MADAARVPEMMRCKVTRKRKYHSKIGAMLANADKPIAARAYRCPHCGFWHLTRRPQDPTPRAATSGERGNT